MSRRNGGLLNLNAAAQLRAIDLFAGAGGSSTGLAQAGWKVTWCANHWREAVEIHALNHPEAKHEVQDLHQAVWDDVPRPDVIWASPSCKGHSQAATRNLRDGRRGTGRKADEHRSTAWAVVSAAETLEPAGLLVENVADFRSWPLYPIWLKALETLGYGTQEIVIDSYDQGVAQERPRVFVAALRGAQPYLEVAGAARRSCAGDVVDLNAGRWKRFRDCRPGVQRRIRVAQEHGHRGAWITQSVTGHKGRRLEQPLPVITTQHQLGVVKDDGKLYRPFLREEYARGMGFPSTYRWGNTGVSKAAEMLGNAVCPPVAAALARAMEPLVRSVA